MEILYVENRDSGVGFRGKIDNLGDIKMSSLEGKKENEGGKCHESQKKAGCWGKNIDGPRKTGKSKDTGLEFGQNRQITVDLIKIPPNRGRSWEGILEIM